MRVRPPPPAPSESPESLDFTGFSGFFLVFFGAAFSSAGTVKERGKTCFSDKANREKPCAVCVSGPAEVDQEVFFPVLLRKIAEDLVGSGYLGAVIEVGVNVAGSADVAVTEPLLNILEGNTVGIEKGRTGVPLRYNSDKPEKSRIFKGFKGFKPDF